jgi:sugar O-acyltransferase (sialic acid O-acetyltransferase NeuD family)
MTKQVIIIGLGGYSANLVDIMRDENAAAGYEKWRPIGYLDDDESRRGKDYYGLPILAGLSEARRFQDVWFVNAIGSTTTASAKPQLINKTKISDERFITLRHPSAFISPTVMLGAGTVISQGCVVMANAMVGRHVKTLPLATISYNVQVADYTTIAGGAVVASDVKIGECCYVGANSCIRERIIVGDRVILGMGAVVVSNVAKDSVMVGVPARAMQSTMITQ